MSLLIVCKKKLLLQLLSGLSKARVDIVCKNFPRKENFTLALILP